MTEDRGQRTEKKGQKKSSAIRLLSFILRCLISAYRYSFACIFGGQCRFTPSCSAYALDAIEMHGPVKGTGLAIARICRCHPWGGHGFEPVQKTENR